MKTETHPPYQRTRQFCRVDFSELAVHWHRQNDPVPPHNPNVVGSNPAPATMKPQVGSEFASDLFRVSSPLGYQVVPKWSRTLLRLPTQSSFARLTVAAPSLKHRRNRPRLHANTHLGRKMERLFYATRPSAYADGLSWKLGAPCHSEGGGAGGMIAPRIIGAKPANHAWSASSNARNESFSSAKNAFVIFNQPR